MKKGIFAVSLMVTTTPLWANPISIPNTNQEFMLDGRCTETAYQEAHVEQIGSGAKLHLIGSERYVFMCIELPQESYGTFDLYTKDSASQKLVNFHVSGQRGERIQQPDGTWPNYVWENQQGWYGNVVVMKWNREDGFECCITSQARELQFEKARLIDDKNGTTLMFEMRAIMDEGGARRGQAKFPEGAVIENPETWARLQFTR